MTSSARRSSGLWRRKVKRMSRGVWPSGSRTPPSQVSQRMARLTLDGSKFSIRSVSTTVRLARWKNSNSIMKSPGAATVSICPSQG